jgi:hypothetical protein
VGMMSAIWSRVVFKGVVSFGVELGGLDVVEVAERYRKEGGFVGDDFTSQNPD